MIPSAQGGKSSFKTFIGRKRQLSKQLLISDNVEALLQLNIPPISSTKPPESHLAGEHLEQQQLGSRNVSQPITRSHTQMSSFEFYVLHKQTEPRRVFCENIYNPYIQKTNSHTLFIDPWLETHRFQLVRKQSHSLNVSLRAVISFWYNLDWKQRARSLWTDFKLVTEERYWSLFQFD